MKKVIRDGKVAVLFSPGFGAGWYSWHHIEALLFDPEIVEMIEQGKHYHDIELYVEAKYGDEPYTGGASDLEVRWLPVGTRFEIHEYDGSESIVTYEDVNWITA